MGNQISGLTIPIPDPAHWCYGSAVREGVLVIFILNRRLTTSLFWSFHPWGIFRRDTMVPHEGEIICSRHPEKFQHSSVEGSFPFLLAMSFLTSSFFRAERRGGCVYSAVYHCENDAGRVTSTPVALHRPYVGAGIRKDSVRRVD